jgi:hypothetical protein
MSRKLCFMAALTLPLQGFALPAVAEVFLYDNSNGAFLWLPENGTNSPITYFDPSQPPAQSGEQTQTSLWYLKPQQQTSLDIGVGSFISVGNIEIAVGDPVTVYGEGAPEEVLPAAEFHARETIGPDADWASRADHSTFSSPLSGPQLLLGELPTIGFRKGEEGHYHYGWIELGPRELPDPYGQGIPYHPIRWAYESELNTPITVIPEPASICSLLLCILFATSLLFVRRAVFP